MRSLVEAGKLLPGKTYEWSARACNGSTCSAYTRVASWTVDPTLGAGERKYFSFKSFKLTDRMTAKANLGTGNLLVEMNDLSVPGVTSDLRLGQTYNSLALAPASHNASGAMGSGWSFSVLPDLGLAIHLDNTVTFWDATGTPVWFSDPSHVPGSFVNDWVTPSAADETLTQWLDGTYHVKVHSSGVEYLFDSDGRLTGINDRSGNTFQITWDASNNVTGVVGTRGCPAVGAPGVTNTARKINITGPSAGQLISQVKQSPNDGSALAARTVQFSYTGSLLRTVTDAAGRVTTFGYDSNNRLNQITSPAGDSTTCNVTTITYQANDGNGNPDYRVKKASQVLDGSTTLDNQFVIDDAARTNKFTDGAGRFTQIRATLIPARPRPLDPIRQHRPLG
jgi:YD repeat-containing protein